VGTNLDDVTAGIRQLTHKLNARKVFVVDDGTPSNAAAAAYAQRQLGTAALAGTASMPDGTHLSALVNKIATSKADSVYYTGDYGQFSVFLDFVAQLRRTRPTITILGWQWAYDDQFVPAAGQQPPDNIYVTCTCIPPSRAGHDFTDHFTRRNHMAPIWYAAEAFDSTNILLSGLAAGRYTRSTMLDWVNHYDGDGVSGHIKFTPTGDLVAPTTWALRYVNGALVPEEPIPSTPTG
jgi:branched-chain amino acid transport system substrate-binding protein